MSSRRGVTTLVSTPACCCCCDESSRACHLWTLQAPSDRIRIDGQLLVQNTTRRNTYRPAGSIFSLLCRLLPEASASDTRRLSRPRYSGPLESAVLVGLSSPLPGAAVAAIWLCRLPQYPHHGIMQREIHKIHAADPDAEGGAHSLIFTSIALRGPTRRVIWFQSDFVTLHRFFQ
jgi:hypothetical protein